MAALTPAQVILITDATAAALLNLKPALGVVPSHTTQGVGDASIVTGSATDYGAHYRMHQLVGAMIALADETLLVNALKAVTGARDALAWQNVAQMAGGGIVSAMTLAAINANIGASDFNTFCLYYNTGAGGPWNCLLAPDYQLLFNAVNVNPINRLNIYSPAIADMGHQTVGSSFVAGAGVAQDGGGNLLYAGVAIAKATITLWAGTSGTLTVTGTNHNGVTGRTWSVTVAGNGTLTLVPATTGDLLTSVQSFSLPPGMTAGTVQISGLIPSGRSNPPV